MLRDEGQGRAAPIEAVVFQRRELVRPEGQFLVPRGGQLFDPVLGRAQERDELVLVRDAVPEDADQYIEVVPPGTPVVLTDVDGTLTTSENEEFFDLLSGTLPDVRPGAPQALQALAERGYHTIYLTARPEFLGTRTEEFVRARGLPPGA